MTKNEYSKHLHALQIVVNTYHDTYNNDINLCKLEVNKYCQISNYVKCKNLIVYERKKRKKYKCKLKMINELSKL